MSTDVFELEAESRPSVALPLPLSEGTGSAVELENMGRVTLRVAARSHFSRPRGTPSLAVTVQDSADGLSWSTIATFSFAASGDQSETVDSPEAFLRASWSVSAGAWGRPSVTAVPFASGASDAGGSSASLTLLGPFTLDHDTAGFLNPANNGVNTIPIPAGSFVYAYAIVTEAFDGAQNGDELLLALLTGPAGSGSPFVEYDAVEMGADNPAVAFYEPEMITESLPRHRAQVAVADCFIVAGIFLTGPTTQGSVDIYAWVATPTT